TPTITASFPGGCEGGRTTAPAPPIAKNDSGWGHPECRTGASV
ncbi:ribonuclease HI, partial [Streptomyces massasporeus]